MQTEQEAYRVEKDALYVTDSIWMSCEELNAEDMIDVRIEVKNRESEDRLTPVSADHRSLENSLRQVLLDSHCVLKVSVQNVQSGKITTHVQTFAIHFRSSGVKSLLVSERNDCVVFLKFFALLIVSATVTAVLLCSAPRWKLERSRMILAETSRLQTSKFCGREARAKFVWRSTRTE